MTVLFITKERNWVSMDGSKDLNLALRSSPVCDKVLLRSNDYLRKWEIPVIIGIEFLLVKRKARLG